MCSEQQRLENIMYDFITSSQGLWLDKVMLKGCLALKAHLPENVNMRLTGDIDLTIKSKSVWENILNNVANIATINSTLGVEYKLVKRRGYRANESSDSITIEANLNNSIYTFKVDMNIKQEEQFLEIGSNINGVTLKVYAIEGILADKLNVLSSRKLCRRIKDLLDVYIISMTFDIRLKDIVPKILKRYPELKGKTDGVFVWQLENKETLRHAYSKYIIRGYEKPTFDEVYARVLKFTGLLYIHLCTEDGNDEDLKWSHERGEWYV